MRPWPTAFAAVDGVSGHGGAAMAFRLDGEVALHKEFPDPWSGEWREEQVGAVGADGDARLRVGDLKSDMAFRLERADAAP